MIQTEFTGSKTSKLDKATSTATDYLFRVEDKVLKALGKERKAALTVFSNGSCKTSDGKRIDWMDCADKVRELGKKGDEKALDFTKKMTVAAAIFIPLLLIWKLTRSTSGSVSGINDFYYPKPDNRINRSTAAKGLGSRGGPFPYLRAWNARGSI
ncbi:MAG: hypothetical protein AAF741_02900 [Bacteroidota bacterium]